MWCGGERGVLTIRGHSHGCCAVAAALVVVVVVVVVDFHIAAAYYPLGCVGDPNRRIIYFEPEGGGSRHKCPTDFLIGNISLGIAVCIVLRASQQLGKALAEYCANNTRKPRVFVGAAGGSRTTWICSQP